MIIYKLTNKINNKIYIGQTIQSFDDRMRGHLYDAMYRKNTSDSRLANAIRKYGFDNFEKEIIDQAETIEELNYLEEYYIEKFNACDRDIGYNIKYGGNNFKLSDETKAKIGNKTKERFYNNTDIQHKVLDGLKKGHDTMKKKSEEYFVEKECRCCGKVMKLKPHIAKTKVYCSKECMKNEGFSDNGFMKEALSKANEVNKDNTYKRRECDKNITIEFALDNQDLINNMPLNKIKLDNLIEKLGYKDIRPIAYAFGLKNGKQLLLELKNIVKIYAEQNQN